MPAEARKARWPIRHRGTWERCDRIAAHVSRCSRHLRVGPVGATINSPKDRASSYRVNDPDDGHVVHAAITGKADARVTDDCRAGFSTSADLDAAQIEVVTARQFAANTVAAHLSAGLRSRQQMAARLTSPPRSAAEILDNLHQRHGMSEVATILTPLLTGPRSA